MKRYEVRTVQIEGRTFWIAWDNAKECVTEYFYSREVAQRWCDMRNYSKYSRKSP